MRNENESYHKWSLKLTENNNVGSIYDSQGPGTERAVGIITVIFHCNCQVVLGNYLFDQVVGTVLFEIIWLSIKCQVVRLTPHIAYTCRIKKQTNKKTTILVLLIYVLWFLHEHNYGVYATFKKKHSHVFTPFLQLTLTFKVIAASIVIVNLDRRTSICTYQRLFCGADSWFLYHCTIDARRSCTVVHIPWLAILDAVKK